MPTNPSQPPQWWGAATLLGPSPNTVSTKAEEDSTFTKGPGWGCWGLPGLHSWEEQEATEPPRPTEDLAAAPLSCVTVSSFSQRPLTALKSRLCGDVGGKKGKDP